MSYAVRIHENGGPEVLKYEEVTVGEPGPNEVRIRHTAIGLNFIDVYERTGLYSNPLPTGLGREAAGVVEATGAGVSHLKVGDRVAYNAGAPGAYSQERLFPADRAVRLPDAIGDHQAAAMMLKGLTVQMLLRQIYPVRAGDAVLIHAAAGGVGSLAVQWAKHLGATVIAIVGSAAKAALARERGADHTLLTTEDWVARTKAITNDQGVNVVYDSVGKDTFFGSLDTLRPRGMMVTYGNASGPVPPVAPSELQKRGSLFLTRPTLFHYTATRVELESAASELFDVVGKGIVNVHIGQTYALRDIAQAHRDLEARRTTGSTVLLP